MTNNEGPVTIDGTFEPVPENKPNTPPQYNDGAMAAAFVKAGLPPLPEQETTPVTQSQPVTESQPTQPEVVSQPTTESQPTQNVSSPTPEVKRKETPPYVIDAQNKALEDAEKRRQTTKPVPTNTPSTPTVTTPTPTQATPTRANPTPVTPTTPVTPSIESTPSPEPVKRESKPKQEKTEPKKTDAPVEIEGAYKSIPEVDAFRTRLGAIKEQLSDEKDKKMVDILIAALGNADVQTPMHEAIKEKNAADRVKQYTDKDGNLVDIPLPIKEEMDKTFDKNMRVADEVAAQSYATMENNHYDNKINERIKKLQEQGFSEEQIKNYMDVAKYEIKDKAQRHVKTRVTTDFRSRVIERIKANPEKYKDYINPNTGEVISSIDDENLMGHILGQKVYPGWMKGEDDAMKNRVEPIKPTPPKVEKDDDDTIVPKKPKKWGLIGGVIGFTAAVAGGASVGGPVFIGASLLAVGACILENKAPKKIDMWEKRLADAKTSEEKIKIEKKLRNWNFINKHAHNTLKFFTGMATGAGIGTFVSNMFMGGKGLVEIVGNRIEAGQSTLGHGINEGAQSQAGSSSEGISGSEGATNSQGASGSEGINNMEPTTDTVDIGGNSIEADATFGIDTSNGILVKGGRVELPGSAWDGNLATKPLGNLSNGALNSSNYTGGATNMGAFNLESALQSNGVTETLLRNNLQTPEIHRLLNIFVSNPSTDLSTALQSLNSEGAKTILEAISN